MKLRRLSVFVLTLSMSFVLGAFAGETTTYVNPVSPTQDGWEDYGFGDPFVMRYNGRYYLYPSTRDDSVGVKCWSSRDLVEWRYEGLCTEEPTTKAAYAPEVYRGNDAFYMTTSPAGKGHYIYRSESPTGPFVLQTKNFGLSIDGSVFTDDSGESYFYSASDRGIMAYRMTSPTQVEPTPIKIGAFMNGWTEGPTVFKHDGVYFATYTGNHVFSRGYRIDAGSGATPTNFTPEGGNPILVSTEGALFGIGHNSIVKGPNLDVYYIVYHSLVGHGKKIGWPVREMNIDRLVLDRETLSVAGPTRWKQTIAMPDVGVWFESKTDVNKIKRVAVGRYGVSGKSAPTDYQDGFLTLEKDSAVVTKTAVKGDFTAEYNLGTLSNSGTPGVLFCFVDVKNYGLLKIKREDRLAEIVLVRDGSEERKTEPLPTLFGETISFASPRSIQVERSGDEFTFAIDDRVFAKANGSLKDGAIGYFAEGGEARCGFFGATQGTRGRSVDSLEEPVPGRIALGLRRTEKDAKSETARVDGKERSVLPLAEGDYVELELNAAKAGYYDVALRYRAAKDAEGTLEFGKGKVYDLTLVENRGSGEFETAIVRKVKLTAGKSKFRISCTHGRFLAADASFAEAATVRPGQTWRFDKPSYEDGAWREGNGSLESDGDLFGKALYGEPGMGDYRVETRVAFNDDRRLGGVLIRASEPAKGGPDNSPKLGIDFVKGYCVTFSGDVVMLEKLDYNRKKLAEGKFTTNRNSSLDLRIDAMGSEIVVSIDGEEALRYRDPDPYLCGRPGVRSIGGSFRVEKFRAAPLNEKE